MNGRGVYYFLNGDKFDGVWIYGRADSCLKESEKNENDEGSQFWSMEQFGDMMD